VSSDTYDAPGSTPSARSTPNIVPRPDTTGHVELWISIIVDLRAGINSGNWRVELWGHNVTDKFYAQTVTHVVDTVARVVGMPATYGVTVGYRMK
jgi:hypothetical protein